MHHTLDILRRLAEQGPCNETAQHVLSAALAAQEQIFDRKRMAGHITCSALVLTPDMSQLLLIHHNAYHTWLPPGGHNEDAEPPFQCAAREVEEETGVRGIAPFLQDGEPLVLDLDTHEIAPRASKEEGAHVHHDLMFLAIAPAQVELVHQESETGGAQWMSLEKAQAFFLGSRLGPPNRRMVRVLARLRELRRQVQMSSIT